jgi:hypothetical protein
MKKMELVGKGLGLAGLAVILIGIAGCSSLKSSGEGFNSSGQTASVTPLYYEFTDILVPGELTKDRKRCLIFQSHGFTAGILTFKANVERGSLISFFNENMVKDNWKVIGSITSSRTILLFQKENRWCIIYVSEGDFSTTVEIGVVPAGDGLDAMTTG